MAERTTPNFARTAYRDAEEFVILLGVTAHFARGYLRRPDAPDLWKRFGGIFAATYVAWSDLSHALTPEVRDLANSVYRAGASRIKLGKARPRRTVIEAIADELMYHFRFVTAHRWRDNFKIAGPDWGAFRSTYCAFQPGYMPELSEMTESVLLAIDGWEERQWLHTTVYRSWVKYLISAKWISQDSPKAVEAAIRSLRCGSIDFDELRVAINREAQAVADLAVNPSSPPIAVPGRLLHQLQAGLAGQERWNAEQTKRLERMEAALNHGKASTDKSAPTVLTDNPAKSPQGTVRPDATPAFVRSVKVAEVAKVVNERVDLVLKKLKVRNHSIRGTKRAFTVEFADVLATFPKLKKRLNAWFEKEYPQ